MYAVKINGRTVTSGFEHKRKAVASAKRFDCTTVGHITVENEEGVVVWENR